MAQSAALAPRAAALPAPFAVHATYSLDHHDELAKAQRFREAGLWRSDPPEPADARYLAVGLPAGSSSSSSSGGGGEGGGAHHQLPPAVRAAVAGFEAKGQSAANIGVHVLALRAYVAELRDALALALVLNRTLVLPRWACYCDRLWSGSDDIFHFGCMYPGAQDGQYVPFVCPMDHVLSSRLHASAHHGAISHRYVPFVCPMDHVLSPFEWNEKRFPYKDHLFLKPLEGTGEIIEIAVGADGGGATKGGATEGGAQDDAPAATEGGGQPSGRAALRLPLGQSAVAVRRALAPYARARVLRLEHTRELLCGLGGAETFEADGVRRLAQLVPALLKPPSWCAKCYQPCLSELKGWLDADTIRRGWRKEGGEEFWCAHFEPPEPLPALCPV